ncbi:mannose-ethanolamine phosphotransferase gpi13 [Rhizopus stolonifer]|uniref:Mannose-ethanolamine phosphotransferase gpi13 n=1 Tax=Rhizopus stolonifer TaxID=4846 RepID=A0A367J8I4_RHIST|nr:mannose-ethanolamine phosphotransferase gpi13 [Rhizopus stolonifer]
MGDHGMSVEGDHGGESVEELMSTLFLYSDRPSFKDEYMQQFSRRIHQSRAEKLDYDIDSISKRLLYNAKEYPIVAQIHLVPTLAYLLQIPIPFGNLGAILPDVLHPLHQGKNRLYHLLHMVEQFRTNALQVYDYLDQYAQQTSQLDFSFSKLNPLKQHLYRAESIMLSLLQEPSFLTDLESDSPSSLDAFTLQLEKAIFAYDTFLISTIKYCQSIWAQFDTGCMLLGVIILGLGTLTSFCLLNQPTVSSTSILKVALPVLSVGLLMVYARYSVLDDLVMSKGWFEKMDFVDWIGASVAIAICSSLLVIKPQATTSQFWNKLDWPLLILASIVQSFTLGSNSLVIWEDRGTLFVLGVLCIFWMVRNLTSIPQFSFVQVILAIIFPMGLLTLARIASFTGQCREEQFPHCNYFHNGLLIFEHSNEGYMSIALLVVTFTLLVYFGAHLGRITNMVVGGVYQISSIIVFYRTVYEIFSKTLDTGVEEKTELALMIQKYVEIYLPRGVYGLFFFGVLLAFIQLYYYSPGQEKRASRMCWTLFILATPVLALLQRPLGSAIILGSPFLIELLCQGAPSSLLIRLTILHFLGHHLFFTTGHQATFTSLPWKAAFIGFQDMHYYTGMVLVTLSTVAGYILTWLGWSVILLETMEEHKAQVSKECLHLLTLLHLIPTFLCAVFVFVLRRHLMTWKIFAPRFLFQVLLQVGAHVAAIISERFL